MAQYDSPYSGTQVDNAVLLNINGKPLVRKNTIALAKAMTKAEMASAGVVLVLGAVAAYDRLGGGLYNYEALLSDANDDSEYLHPVDFDGAGLLRKVI